MQRRWYFSLLFISLAIACGSDETEPNLHSGGSGFRKCGQLSNEPGKEPSYRFSDDTLTFHSKGGDVVLKRGTFDSKSPPEDDAEVMTVKGC